MVQFHPDLTGLLAPIDSIQQHPENYNNGDIDAIAESIEVSGMYRPIYVQKSTGFILAGNHTWAACKQLGAEEIPVIWLDCDDVTAMRVLVADNELARLARPDNAALVNLLETLAEVDTLHGTGHDEASLEALRHLAEIPVEYDEFATWPMIQVRVPPHVKAAYLTLTDVAVGDRERFELLLRLAGWDGKATASRGRPR